MVIDEKIEKKWLLILMKNNKGQSYCTLYFSLYYSNQNNFFTTIISF